MVAVPKYSILEKIRPIAEQDRTQNMLIYGHSGSGKTTFAGTAPKPILLLDVRERGTQSIESQPDTYELPIDNWEEIDQVYFMIKENSSKYKTVVIDTVTGLQRLAKEHVGGGKLLLQQKQWGEISDRLQNFIDAMAELPVHVIFLGQEKELKNREGDVDEVLQPMIGVAVMESVLLKLNAAMDVIGHTFIRPDVQDIEGKKIVRGKFALHLAQNPRFITKVRKDRLLNKAGIPDYIIDPTFEKVMSIVKGGR